MLVIDGQIGELSGDAVGLAQALAAVLSHVHGEDCPVCGRDFREVSSEPLTVRLSAQISQLTERAGRIEALSRAKADTTGQLASSERERASLIQRRLEQNVRVATKGRVAELSDAHRNLETLAEAASGGSVIIRKDAEARGRLAALRDRSKGPSDIRNAVQQLCGRLDQAMGDEEPIPEVLTHLDRYIAEQMTHLTGQQKLRHQVSSDYRRLGEIEEEARTAIAKVKDNQETFRILSSRLESAEKGRQQARGIAAAAKRTRSGIVSRVFSDSLNAVWRDLFVRLAPDEPYVPAFKLPESSDAPVVAALETVHRSGGRGGAPGAMLSAGNLNTAALTLFLALHLSVSSRLPWLVLDDPVQSMDEVHVAQFAALLRTLSKEHDRQIVIAVHDRALFDYLGLELSPAFPDDQLIMVELSRSAGADTLAEPSYRIWQQDTAIAAG